MVSTVLAAIVAAIFSVSFTAKQDVAEDMKHQVATSVYYLDGETSTGTGFTVQGKSGRKYIMTNEHVCDQPTPVMTAVDPDKNKVDVKLIKKFDKHDLCLLEAPEDAVPLSLANNLYKDERVFIVGYPLVPYMSATHGRLLGYDYSTIETIVAPSDCKSPKLKLLEHKEMDEKGKTITTRQCVIYLLTLETTAPTDLGGSGSPLLNDDGDVVGVVMAVGGRAAWASAVPLQFVREFLDSH